MKILKNHNADIDSQDNRRVSCLMAAFRKGHTKVVEFMVNHVTQFPSDQEMTRYIATVSDKELADKCKECVKTIRAAKEAQAVKANKNASILLEELDMEKNREENRKAAAARRRERKKKKKMEKKEEKRKLMESEQEKETTTTNSKKKGQTSTENKEVASPEKEETDSGIDVHSLGSYSSADNKNNNATNKSNDNASNKMTSNKSEVGTTDIIKKNQKANKNSNQSKKNKSPNRLQESDDEKEIKPTKKKDDSHSTESKHQASNDNCSENNIKNNNHHKEKDGKHRNTTQNDSNEKDTAANASNYNSRGTKEKDRLNNKTEIHTDTNKNETNEKTDNHSKFNSHDPVVTALHHKTSRTTTSYHNDISDGEVSYFNSSRNKNIKSTPQHENTSKITTAGVAINTVTKSNASHTFKREEGWKEVSRKSSTQQHPTSDSAVKKIIIPTYAISRVIGRAGSNINAIRAATGAHIEVEKQGKSQNDRMITIKGTNDATKQASVLIGALVKDPEVDILQMLPKVNNNARSIPPSNVIEKPIAPIIQPITSTATSCAVGPKVSKPVSTIVSSASNTVCKVFNMLLSYIFYFNQIINTKSGFFLEFLLKI